MEQTSRDGGIRVPPHLTYPFTRPAGKTILRYAMNLPETQKDVIHRGDSNLRLIARAGSGKMQAVGPGVTKLLTTGRKPGNIAVFTTTDNQALKNYFDRPIAVRDRRIGRRELAYRGGKPMRMALAFVLLLLSALAAPAASGQDAMTTIRFAPSLPVPQRGLTNPSSGTNCFKGPIPFADVTCWGARPIHFSGTVPQTKASCNGTNRVALDSAAGFQVGDGITIYGCGGKNKMETPSAPIVTPSEAAGETGTGWVVNSPTGRSRYSYIIVARDKYGAITKPSPPTTISKGLATLGLQRVNITSLTRSNDKVKAVTATNQLVALAAVQIESTASRGFNGFYSVAKIDSGMQFELFGTPIDTQAQGWQVGDVVTVGSGGSVAYYLGNHLSWTAIKGAWEYYVCAERPGDAHFHLIGVTKPTGPSSGYQDVQFDDWGSPYMDLQTYPPYIQTAAEAAFNNNPTNMAAQATSNAICTAGAATDDPLTTIITGINGSTVTVANAAAQTVASTTAIFDDGPTILAAAKSVSLNIGGFGGTIYIPPGTTYPNVGYEINSYTVIPSGLTVWQAGSLVINETVEVDNGVNWLGDWGNGGTPQFGFNNGVGTETIYANPMIYINGYANTFRRLGLYTTAPNGGTLIVGDNINGTNFSHVNFITGNGGAATDYLSTAFVLRDTSGTIDNSLFDTVLFYSGPDQVSDKSWSPLFLIVPSQNGSGGGQNSVYSLTIRNSYWNRRGMAMFDQGGGGVFEFDNLYRQGGITPLFMLEMDNVCTSCGNFIFTNEAQDTEGEPVIAGLYLEAPSDVPMDYNVYFNNVSGSGPNGSLISGERPVGLKIDGFNYFNALINPNRDAVLDGTVSNFTYAPYAASGSYVPIQGGLETIAQAVHIPSGHSFFFDLQPPTSISGTAAAGGSVPAGGWFYAVNATGADGGETILSAPSSPVRTALGVNQTVNLTWTPAIGAYSYNIYRCTGASCLTSNGTASNGVLWYRVAQHVVGLSYSDTAASPSKVTIPQVGGTGATIASKNGVYAPVAQAGTISTGGGAQVFGSAENSTTAACETNYGITKLATRSTTTNTGLDCLPANAIIDAVVYRITSTITTAANFTIGDASTANRFCTTQSKLAAETTGICIAQSGSGAAIQNAAASVRVTTNAIPGGGLIRLIVYYHTWTPPAN
jgi:hypothetical protein